MMAQPQGEERGGKKGGDIMLVFFLALMLRVLVE
jgi:hypothetical protein